MEVIYLIAAVTFMIGLKMLSKPDSARKGNGIAAFGMVLAIFATIFIYRDANGMHLKNLMWIFLALIIGTVIGYLMAKRVQMTAMPQMVSFFNGMGEPVQQSYQSLNLGIWNTDCLKIFLLKSLSSLLVLSLVRFHLLAV